MRKRTTARGKVIIGLVKGQIGFAFGGDGKELLLIPLAPWRESGEGPLSTEHLLARVPDHGDALQDATGIFSDGTPVRVTVTKIQRMKRGPGGWLANGSKLKRLSKSDPLHRALRSSDADEGACGHPRRRPGQADPRTIVWAGTPASDGSRDGA
jgi:hypothetical protein